MRPLKEALFRHRKPKRYIHNQDSASSGCVVSGSLALVLRVSRGVGMSPLSVTRASAGWRFTPSSTIGVLQKILMSVCNLVILAGLSWDLCLEVPKRIRAGVSTMKTVVWICDLFLVMLIANIAIYMGMSRMESLLKVLKQLQQINLSLKVNPPFAKSETIRSSMIICLLIWVMVLQFADVYNLTLAAFKENKMFAGPIMSLSTAYNYATVLEIIVALQWYYTASGAHAAAAALNQQLQQLRDVNLKSDFTSAKDDSLAAPQSVLTLVNSFMATPKRDAEISKPQAQATIRSLAVSFDRISEVIIHLNTSNGLILLLMIATNTMRLVLSPYYLLLSVFSDDDVVASVVLLQSNWIVFHIIKLLLVVEPCHWTQEERGHTELLLSQLTAHLAPKCDGISEELNQFTKQVVLTRAQFMPLGISTLSRPLIVTILSSVTTYLIIMIQFQKISTQL